MRAAALLGDSATPGLGVLLRPVRPEEVSVRAVPALLRPLWPPGVAAMAMPWGIYVRTDLLGGDPEVLARLLVHELVHVRQWRTLGTVGFLRRYLADYLRGRVGGLDHRSAYLAIDAEIEADRIERTLR